MTQTAPPNAPAQGIAATPVTVVAGVLTQIPRPLQATQGPQPVPTLFPWVVILNASPYTLVISTGSTTTQIAAFNSDKVYVYPGGGPSLTFLAVAGAAVPLPGTDSTVYATFYADEPPGTYPAFIGPGAPTALQSQVAVVSGVTLPGGQTRFPVAGLISTAGFAGLSCLFTVVAGSTTPLTVTITWADAAGDALAQRTIIVPLPSMAGNGTASFTIPHVGPFFFIQVSGTVVYSAAIYQTTVATTSWDVNVPTQSLLIPVTSTAALGGGVFTVIGSSLSTFAGNAMLWIAPTATSWNLILQISDGANNWSNLLAFPNGGQIPQGGGTAALLVPPQPLRFLFQNGDAGAHTPQATLTADDSRWAA